MSEPTGVAAELVREEAAAFDGRSLAPARAEEIAAEVDRLNRLVLRTSGRSGPLLADPTSFPAALDALRDPWPADAPDGG